VTTIYKSRTSKYSTHYSKLYRMGYRCTVDPLGTQRRIQALAAIGYSSHDISQASGVYPSMIQDISAGKRKRIALKTAAAIEKVYGNLSARPIHGARANWMRNMAKKNKWAPPMSWDDIDNPDERPKGMVW
jgi:hypothetical protein